MPRPKAILFDLDDTLISFDGVSHTVWQTVCQAFTQEHATAFTTEELLQKLHETRRWYWGDPERHRTGRADLAAARRYVTRLALSALGWEDGEAAARLADTYMALHDASLFVFDGAAEALAAIRAMGIRLAMITNGTQESQRGKLIRFGLSDPFEHILVEGEVGFGKPDPRIYRLALDKLSLPPGDVWMIGDNLVWDVHAPQQLGIYGVWNDYRGRGLPPDTPVRPDLIVSSAAELAKILNNT